MRWWSLFVVSILLVAGCTAPNPPAASQSNKTDTVGMSPATDMPTSQSPTGTATPQKAIDIGVVDGIRATQSLAINGTDGYNETELELIVARTSARIEVLRDLDFKEVPEMEVITRSEFQDRDIFSDEMTNESALRWNEQVWEALFIVPEDETVTETRDDTLATAVVGYYSPETKNFVVVSDDENVSIDYQTVVHELVHALQDQHFGLNSSRNTQDGQLAAQGATEGEANYIQALYENACRQERWECLPRSYAAPPPQRPGHSFGYLVTIFQPYNDGPFLIEHVYEREGWAGVNQMLRDNRPVSTEQVIHPEKYPDEKPIEMSIPDRSNHNWTRYRDLPADHPVGDRVGEASLVSMLAVGDVIDIQHIFLGGNLTKILTYNHTETRGWEGDKLIPYKSVEGSGDGYVFVTAWESREDAREFHEAYLAVLDETGALKHTGNRYMIPEGSPYHDAIRVTQQGKRVVIVNAPTLDQLDSIHASS